jgi:hypothetical protein
MKPANAIVSPPTFQARGYCVEAGFLTPEACAHLLERIARYRATHEVPEVYRKVRGRSLHYFVIDGHQVEQYLPDVGRLYEQVNGVVNETCGRTMVPLENRRVGANVNITPPGGEYRWHYDRNAVTAILYLNEVPGGETELYPNYRLRLKQRYSALQRWLDRLLQAGSVRRVFGRRVVVTPRQGNLVLMAGNTCLHSVRPVAGDEERINLILAYDEPGAHFAIERNLDAYLYTEQASASSDPNYA